MEYRELGRSGVKIAPLGLGTGNFADPTPEDEGEPYHSSPSMPESI